MSWEELGLAALVLALALVTALVGVYVGRRLAARTHPPTTETTPQPNSTADEPPSGPAAIVVNPTKVTHLESLRSTLRDLSTEAGLPEPLWFETTVEDPGTGQAQAAVAAGASVVIAAGGDGTVRAVASGLVETGIPMALLPLGTGNLLARNLDVPFERGTRSLLRTALTGREHTIDLGWLRAEREGPEQDDVEHAFLVAGGLGFDAAMVAGADDQLKARVGWLAYFVAGVQHLHGRKTRLTLQVDDQPPVALKLRSLLFANCGRLPGGMVLLPDAEIDDGWLDVAAIDTRGGLIGWASLFGKVALQGVGVRRDLPGQPGSIESWRGRELTVRCAQPESLQVDGDLVGQVVAVHVRVAHAALIVRTR